ncbi:MAG TPA: DegT/DnrJ/EryC1/StrS family aminotransferase [Bacteroidales bacterium]|nr:DegT/DnrJ/EryC1/StrS family aminotransferase [Bacteroidales bacterium]
MIPFSPPRIDQKIIDEVTAALKSGWITTGPRTKQFEKMLSAYAGHRATLCVNSASSGLELMLRWFGVKEGDEVIVPAYTYSATANVVIHCGAKPVMVDIGDDFNIDVDKIREAITPATKVIIPVDLAGLPCDYKEINALVANEAIRKMFRPHTAEQKMLGRILVLADAAHSVGAVYHGMKTGSLTDISVYSFHAVKNLTTAEGGAVCLNLPEPFDNEEVYKYLCIKSLHGQTKDALAKAQAGNWQYDVIEAGYKYNMTDIQAAMGMVELERYDDDMLVRRKEIFDLYRQGFSNKKWAILPPYETDSKTSSYHVFLLRIKDATEEQRNRIMGRIFEKGVSVNVHFIPLPMLSLYKGLGYDIAAYPKSYLNYERVISLPVYYTLSNDNVQTVVNTVLNSVEEILS